MKLPFNCEGLVVHGFGRGHTIGFATANLATESWTVEISEEDYGVYSGIVHVRDDPPRIGVVSVGKNKTFEAKNPSFEVHILDFDEDIYDLTIKVELKKLIRPMILFKSVDELISQISSDAQAARRDMQEFVNH